MIGPQLEELFHVMNAAAYGEHGRQPASYAGLLANRNGGKVPMPANRCPAAQSPKNGRGGLCGRAVFGTRPADRDGRGAPLA